MDVLPCADGVAHLRLRGTRPEVAGILCLAALVVVPVLPGIPEESAEDEGVELLRSTVAEHLVLELLWPIGALEVEAEGVLGVLLRQSAMPAVQLQAAVHCKVVVGLTAYHLEADRSLPPSSRSVAHGTAGEDVDAARHGVGHIVEEVALVCDEGDDGQRRDALRDVRRIGLVARYLRIHLVVGGGRSRDLAVPAPLGGIAVGRVTLCKKAVREDVGGCRDVAPSVVGHEVCRADDGRCVDAERPSIEHSLLPRVAPVVGVIDDGILHGRRYPQAELLIIDTVRYAELRPFAPSGSISQHARHHTQ